ncbi:hypothetical protein BSAE_5009 [Bifidobacterium pullorum subsp. saeculare DSM 6531 = LMG 14934]|uniref:Uncharacterized protein n=1 Tax=Bifidobacterium pullorum subsp. saeculare DSM 6531 = LMG 14934 TaxID=1437611 RepID=A0A087CWV2_9BIFI|nr:hypothetical protein BSAE_5009 [Bifidobacterium pullorum subsp. saeculare DSM 6531 = LMG 14934]
MPTGLFLFHSRVRAVDGRARNQERGPAPMHSGTGPRLWVSLADSALLVEHALDAVPHGLGERVVAERRVGGGERGTQGLIHHLLVHHGCFLSLWRPSWSAGAVLVIFDLLL